ncbi:hypothetical protein ACFQ6N_04470 [Kitasatospora sp. NPDC056446]|uniref:hypothetical protein n=1 Tax=Kitasatospora sp. NPDC056446 TaxID=3345819 RepID=UPI0036C2C173
MRVPQFSSVFDVLPGTALVATIPRRLAELRAVTDPRVRLVEAPEGFDAFPYGMVWHARLDRDPMHSWLRDTIRAAARDLGR